MKKKLWTRDFTIVTAGTLVSMIGNTLAGITISILVLDHTGSTLLYAVFMVMNNAPKIIVPLVAGPLLDRFSRKKTIFALDYMSGILYYIMFIMLSFNTINYVFLLFATTMFGVLDSVYNVAYESLYPNLISKENYTKGYSVASMLYPVAALATPLGAFLYDAVGIAPIIFINAATFFVAAFCENFVDIKEKHLETEKRVRERGSYKKDFEKGIKYIFKHNGLLMITVYFCFNMFCDATQSTLVLPFFKSTAGLSEMLYTILIISGVGGRLLGGMIHYRFKYPPKIKFFIACFVYIATCAIDGAMLFVPVAVMIMFQFLSGVMGSTSFNIRTSAIQTLIPDGYRARLNGIFSVVFALGSIAGQLASGALAEVFPIRGVVVLFSSLNIVFVYALVLRNRKDIRPVYNIEV